MYFVMTEGSFKANLPEVQVCQHHPVCHVYPETTENVLALITGLSIFTFKTDGFISYQRTSWSDSAPFTLQSSRSLKKNMGFGV